MGVPITFRHARPPASARFDFGLVRVRMRCEQQQPAHSHSQPYPPHPALCRPGRHGLGHPRLLRLRRDERLYLRRGHLGHRLVVHRSRSHRPAVPTLRFGVGHSRARRRHRHLRWPRLDAVARLLRRPYPAQQQGVCLDQPRLRLLVDVHCRYALGGPGSLCARLDGLASPRAALAVGPAHRLGPGHGLLPQRLSLPQVSRDLPAALFHHA